MYFYEHTAGSSILLPAATTKTGQCSHQWQQQQTCVMLLPTAINKSSTMLPPTATTTK